jgi:hypothetical protein
LLENVLHIAHWCLRGVQVGDCRRPSGGPERGHCDCRDASAARPKRPRRHGGDLAIGVPSHGLLAPGPGPRRRGAAAAGPGASARPNRSTASSIQKPPELILVLRRVDHTHSTIMITAICTADLPSHLEFLDKTVLPIAGRRCRGGNTSEAASGTGGAAPTWRRMDLSGLGRSAEADKTRSGSWLTTTLVKGTGLQSPGANWPSPPDAADAIARVDAPLGPTAPSAAAATRSAEIRNARISFKFGT